MAKDLIDAGANINGKDKNENEVLNESIRSGNDEIVKWIIKKLKESLKGPNKRKRVFTAGLYIAIECNKLKIADELINLGANIYEEDDNHLSALELAILLPNERWVGILIEKGADLNQKNSQNGKTPLIVSILQDSESMVAILLKNKVDVNIKFNGYLPIELAKIVGNEKIAKMLEDEGAVIKEDSRGNGSSESSRSNENEKSNKGKETKNIDVSNTLKTPLNNFLDLKDKNGSTPLHISTEIKDISGIRKLIKKGANPYLENNEGQTALHIAAQSGIIDLVLSIIEEFESKNSNGSRI